MQCHDSWMVPCDIGGDPQSSFEHYNPIYNQEFIFFHSKITLQAQQRLYRNVHVVQSMSHLCRNVQNRKVLMVLTSLIRVRVEMGFCSLKNMELSLKM